VLLAPAIRRAVAIGLVAVLGAGCRGGLAPDRAAGLATEATLQAADDRPRTAPQTIPLELIFVRHEEHDPVMRDELWNLVDEQAFDDALRRRLIANGLRAGVVTATLPPHLAERFEPTGASPGDSLPAALPDNPALVRHLLRLLPGRSSDVLAASGLAQLVVLRHDADGVHGGTFSDASALVALKAWPAADGRVKLRLEPTIKHGPMERSWVGEDGMFRLEAGQRRDVLQGLEFEATVPSGSMLLVGCSGAPASTAGDALFRDKAGSRSGQRLLAIRPLAGNRAGDPMFAPSSTDTAATD
jgi:hypothetical protein